MTALSDLRADLDAIADDVGHSTRLDVADDGTVEVQA